ncbi:MAG TPA: chromate efflux transporter [Gammaproteobacteria bacterium]
MTTEKSSLAMTDSRESLWMLFWTFLKIGSTAFGGFMALISVVQNYMVERRKLLSHGDMLDGVSLATILPGPVAVNVVAYAGYRVRGIAGALVCATAVIIPSFFLILGLSYAYFTWGEIPAVNNIFKGFLPAVAAIIVSAAFNMGKKSLSTYAEYAIAIAAMLILTTIGGFYSTLFIIFLSGLIGYVFFDGDANHKKTETVASKHSGRSATVIGLSVLSVSALLYVWLKTNIVIAAKLFATFSGMSLLLFGGGFVFIPLIKEIVVDTNGWVTYQEFIDGIALGQVTPGPILISATFIGYKVGGVIGAISATIGIFAPPAMLMLMCTHFLERIKSSDAIRSTLKGIRCGVIGMIAAAAYVVIMSAEQNVASFIIFSLALVALFKFKLEVAWIIPAAGVIGFLFY